MLMLLLMTVAKTKAMMMTMGDDRWPRMVMMVTAATPTMIMMVEVLAVVMFIVTMGHDGWP